MVMRPPTASASTPASHGNASPIQRVSDHSCSTPSDQANATKPNTNASVIKPALKQDKDCSIAMWAMKVSALALACRWP